MQNVPNEFPELYIILIRMRHQIAQFKLTHFVCRCLFENDVSIIPKGKHAGRDGVVRKPPYRIRDEWRAESSPFSSTLHKQIRVTSSKVRCKFFPPTSWNYEILLTTGATALWKVYI